MNIIPNVCIFKILITHTNVKNDIILCILNIIILNIILSNVKYVKHGHLPSRTLLFYLKCLPKSLKCPVMIPRHFQYLLECCINPLHFDRSQGLQLLSWSQVWL